METSVKNPEGILRGSVEPVTAELKVQELLQMIKDDEIEALQSIFQNVFTLAK